jgi:ATP-binding cassette, subfamily B, bacterial PglK
LAGTASLESTASEDQDVKLIRQLWYILSRRERIEGSILLCALALGALFEAVSIGLVVPFIVVLKEPGLVIHAPAARPLLSFVNIRTPRELLIAVGIGLAGAFVIKSGYLVFVYGWLVRYVFEKHVRLTRRLLDGYLSAPYTFHLQRNTAELMKDTTGTVQRFCTGFLAMLLVVAGELLVVLALGILLVLIDPLATFGAALILGVPTALVYQSMQRRLARSGRLADTSLASMLQWTEQAMSGIKETLVMDRADFFIERHGYHAREFADAWRAFTLFGYIPRLVIDTLAVIVMVAIVLVTLLRGQALESVLPVLGMFAVAAIRLMPSVNRIAQGLTALRFHYVTSEVLYQQLIETQGYGFSRVHSEPNRNCPLPLPFTRSLVLEHLTYRYPSMSRPAVDDVSLAIPRGHWVAFIGPTGAGKTTLVDLILGLLVPTGGRIVVDGRDLQDDVAAWQRNIGYVPQDVYLMDDTVQRNVAFGLPEQEIDDERIWHALRAAQIEPLVRSLPGGLNTMIGQRGDRLSGGERQRLGIARALYRDPQVLVVDEATANLDNPTEAAIERTLAGLRGKTTIIVIAHRLPLVLNCDFIYFLRQGRVQNAGAYSDLLSTDQAFRQFAEGAT